MFVATGICCDRSFVATKYFCGDKSFVVTSILLSRQKMCFVVTNTFVMTDDKMCVCHGKNYTGGSSCQ